MLGKNILVSGKGYIRVQLNPEETEKAMEELTKFNILEMEKIIMRSKNTGLTSVVHQTDFIRMLFDKQAISSFTWLQAKLDEKIEKIRNL